MPGQWHLGVGDFFEDLPQEREAFLKLARTREISRNEIVFFEGDPGHSCFYLERGLIKIFRITPSGKESIFFLRRSGELFGLAEVMDSSARKANAQALSPCLLHEMPCREFNSFLEEYITATRKVVRTLGRRVRYLGEQVSNLMVCDVSMRLVKLLVYIGYDRLQTEDAWLRPVHIPVRLTQEQMAAMTGSCQQTVSELLNRYQEEGLIEFNRKEIVILNPLSLLEKAQI
ncbi:MAG: Crp/Fnr family transcriptional regulator [Desulfonatronovibrionaceae bacterium]